MSLAKQIHHIMLILIMMIQIITIMIILTIIIVITQTITIIIIIIMIQTCTTYSLASKQPDDHVGHKGSSLVPPNTYKHNNNIPT